MKHYKKGQMMKKDIRQYRVTIRLNSIEYGNLQLMASCKGLTLSKAIRLIMVNSPPVASNKPL